MLNTRIGWNKIERKLCVRRGFLGVTPNSYTRSTWEQVRVDVVRGARQALLLHTPQPVTYQWTPLSGFPLLEGSVITGVDGLPPREARDRGRREALMEDDDLVVEELGGVEEVHHSHTLGVGLRGQILVAVRA